MSRIKNELGIEVEFSPWMNSHYKLNTLHIVEQLGGKLAYGEIKLMHDNSNEALKLVTDQRVGEIMIRDTKEKGTGIEYKIPIFITSRKFYKTTLDLSFLCIPNVNFIEDPISADYDDITDALNSIYPGNKDIRTKTDIDNGVRVFQMCETGYDFCTRLAYSFRHNTVFAYSWEGLMIKELCGEKNSKGEVESLENLIELSALGLMNYASKYELTYNSDLEYSPINPWEDKDEASTKQDYTSYEFKNALSMSDYDIYNICKRDNFTLLDNYRTNTNLMKANLYYNLYIYGKDFPGYKIGDVIKFTSPEQVSSYPFEVFIVASNEIFFASNNADELSPHGLTFEWTSKLYGINKGKWAEKEE